MTDNPPRVLLIYPPSRTQRHGTMPMGLLMVAAALELQGCEVRLLDANAVGRSWTSEEIADEVRSTNPDVVSITLLTPMVKEAYRLAGMLKNSRPRLLAGGPHATILPEEPLHHGFDAVVVGEGEPTVYEAVLAVLGRIPREKVLGLAFLDEAGCLRMNDPRPYVKDLDTLPMPARHLIDPADYGSAAQAGLYGNIFSSRGCPGRCTYCAGQLFGKKFRFRSAENVVAEVAEVHRRYGTKHFFFVDDAMSMDRPRMVRICEGLREIGPGITWNMMTRIDSVDAELLEMAAGAGCTQIDYGVESGSPETLRKIRKPHTLEMVKRIVPLTRRYGIKPYVFFIMGFPWEDRIAIRATRELMEFLIPYVDTFHPAIASILIPFPGTAIYDEYHELCGFTDWWLGDERCYDAPSLKTHAFWETRLFRNGAVFDADFFGYNQEIKREIFAIFSFMYRHNLRLSAPLPRAVHQFLFHLSRRLSAISSDLERWLVGYPIRVLGGIHRMIRQQGP